MTSILDKRIGEGYHPSIPFRISSSGNTIEDESTRNRLGEHRDDPLSTCGISKDYGEGEVSRTHQRSERSTAVENRGERSSGILPILGDVKPWRDRTKGVTDIMISGFAVVVTIADHYVSDERS